MQHKPSSASRRSTRRLDAGRIGPYKQDNLEGIAISPEAPFGEQVALQQTVLREQPKVLTCLLPAL